MVKCPKGTPEQINRNLAYFLRGRIETNCRTDGVCNSESEELFVEEEGYQSIVDFDVIRADQRNPPTTEDEITYLFVNHFLDILLKCWDGTPCIRPKLAKPVEVPESEKGEFSERKYVLDDKDTLSATEEDLIDLYKTKSQKLTRDKKREGASLEDTLSGICRERCDSRQSSTINEFEDNEREDGSAHLWKVVIPDEDVHMSFHNGAWYKGRVSRRLMDGFGTFFWEDGASFQGEFIAGAIDGKGRLEFPDLSVYEGGVYKGFRHGEGLHCMHASPLMYSGEWWLGKKSGHGIIFYSDPKHGPDFYKGSWVNGKKEGFGFRQYPSGAKYLGHWRNGKRDGTGIMFWCNNDIYRGEWKNGLMEGFGEYMWNGFVNKTFSCARVNTYRGFWANGKRNGVGLMELSNGSIIETIWSDNEKDGPGAVVCPNGTVVLSDQKLFCKDKPALLNETEENLLGKVFRSRGFPSSRRKNVKKETTKVPDQSQVLAYMSSIEKAKVISIPIHTPVHSLDLSCHAKRLMGQSNEALQKQKEQISIFGLNNTPRLESFSEKKVINSEDVNQQEEMFSSEEKLLRHCVMVNLTRLTNTYEEWSTIACTTKPPFRCTLLRLFFWELLTVSDVPMRNFSLIDIDNLLVHCSIYQQQAAPYLNGHPSNYETMSMLLDHLGTVVSTWLRPLTVEVSLQKSLFDSHGTLVEGLMYLIVATLRTASEASFLIDSPHDPFEKIQFWQFIHFLITLSWYKYGRYVLAENITSGNEEVEDFLEEFYNQNEKAVLASGFNYFLQNHIFAERKTVGSVIKNWDLLPMGAMYLAYKSIGEPQSAKEFLIEMRRRKKDSNRRKSDLPRFGKAAYLGKMGKNVIPITNELSYMISEEPFNEPEISTLLNEENEVAGKGESISFSNLGAEDIVRCLVQACPNIMEGDLIVDMEYQLTFLEYYKAITACAVISLKKKALKEIQSEIISHYKKELEEYEEKMNEYEKRRDSLQLPAKKMSQMKKTKK